MRSCSTCLLQGQPINNVLGSLHNLLIFFLITAFQMFNDIFAILMERILKTFRHENIASENAAHGRSLNFVYAVSPVVNSFVLLHSQLQFAHSFLDQYFEDNILSGFLGKSIVHFDDLVISLFANSVNCVYCLLEMVQRVVHNFASQQVAHLAFCFVMIGFSFLDNLCNLFCPSCHDDAHNLSHLHICILLLLSLL